MEETDDMDETDEDRFRLINIALSYKWYGARIEVGEGVARSILKVVVVVVAACIPLALPGRFKAMGSRVGEL